MGRVTSDLRGWTGTWVGDLGRFLTTNVARHACDNSYRYQVHDDQRLRHQAPPALSAVVEALAVFAGSVG